MKKGIIVFCLLVFGIFGFTNSEAKRDPFKPFLELESSRKGYEISELKLIGIIGSDPEGYRALVEDKAGVGFILTEGTPIGSKGIGSKGTIVKEIRIDRVIILEKYQDLFGREKVREVVWTLKTKIQ